MQIVGAGPWRPMRQRLDGVELLRHTACKFEKFAPRRSARLRAPCHGRLPAHPGEEPVGGVQVLWAVVPDYEQPPAHAPRPAVRELQDVVQNLTRGAADLGLPVPARLNVSDEWDSLYRD